MVYGYARVSTKGQEKYGFGLDAQIEQLKTAGAEEIYSDSFTGRKMDRPEFQKLLKVLKSGDTLIVCKLDRIGRSVSKATDIITELIDKGIIINVLNLGILSNSSISTFMRNVLLCFAQLERDMIVERTQEGREIARQKPGYKEGRPKKFNKKKLDLAMELMQTNSAKQVAEMTGISRATLFREKAKREKKQEDED